MDEHVREDMQVSDASDRSRFEITVAGRLAGFAGYRTRGGSIVFTHTEIGDAYRGRGVGARLASAALDSARSRGLEVRPLCPYIAAFIRTHPEYLDLVDAQYREQVS